MQNSQVRRTDDSPLASRMVVLASADAALRHRLAEGLHGLRWTVHEASGGADAMAQVERDRPEALLIDSWLPDLEVGEFSAQMMALYPTMDVLRLDGSAGRANGEGRSPRRGELLHAVRAAQADGPGIQDVIPTPQAALIAAVLERPTEPRPSELLPEMIGESAAMRELARMIRLVSPWNVTVLIEGDTGTGKEIVARAVHRLSPRAAKSFTVLNCAAIPESLLEAELFGHTRGAFTGAVQSRMGRIEAAHGGTLFLDEIGEMPLALQAKMLRFLEYGELQRVGDNEVMRVDVRVVAATHQHLEQRSHSGTFRLDLYHRLAVFPLEVPALHTRVDDIPLLVSFFLERMGREMPRKTISPAAIARLQTMEWPGNVRELKHMLERGAILAGDRAEIDVDDLRWRGRSSQEPPF